eukprot:4091653-Pyramimonas_sp.AAC.1
MLTERSSRCRRKASRLRTSNKGRSNRCNMENASSMLWDACAGLVVVVVGACACGTRWCVREPFL